MFIFFLNHKVQQGWQLKIGEFEVIIKFFGNKSGSPVSLRN